ncbi:hypothetical protein [Azospirillum picis]|uniref:Uncharacterized protein n=1 Tax=Azospirillum picis TaxID=488438 RepID=A0ABU0MSM6_9PROT|nr:hypothetical protein [Azospirillum picis]MBP2302736.1 hypothetical protein [Azospirillum picis]MDQ0536487.1 hypothetical protein [Azospirillum picis]
MSTIALSIASGARLSVSGLAAIQATPVAPSAAEADETEAFLKAGKLSSTRVFADMAAQLERQNAVPVHSVFRSGGTIVGVLYQNGTVAQPSGTGSVLPRGSLSLDAYAGRLGAALKAKHGGNLTVEQWRNGGAPTQGQMNDALFRPHDRLGVNALQDAVLPRTNVAFDARTLEAMLGL